MLTHVLGEHKMEIADNAFFFGGIKQRICQFYTLWKSIVYSRYIFPVIGTKSLEKIYSDFEGKACL